MITMDKRLLEACKDAVSAVKNQKMPDFLSAFRQIQDAAQKAGDQELEKFMRLLWGVFSMYFQFAKGQPFGPLMSGPQGRTLIPEDLTSAELAQLEETLEGIDNPAFVARICDVLWIRKKNFLYAQRTIKAYLQSVDEDNDETWVPKSEWLKRSTQIAMELGEKAQERQIIKQKLLQLFEDGRTKCFTDRQDYWPATLLGLIIENKLADDWNDLGDKAVAIAKGFPISPGCDAPRKYYKLAAKCYELANQTEKAKQAKLALAKHWEDEARSFKTPGGGDGFNLAHRLEKAIYAYREAGNSAKAEQLVHELKEANKMALGQMKAITSPLIDAAPLLNIADEGIGNKTGIAVIEAFAILVTPFSYAHEEESAKKMLKEHPLQGLFNTQIFTEEGNVAATIPGMTDNYEESIKAHAVRGYNLGQSLSASTTLKRGIDLVVQSSDSWKDGIKEFIASSVFVPKDRADIYERAIIAGFEGDLLLFTHLIVPQIENSVRLIFGANKLKITAVREGVQQERDLNQLLTDPEAEKIFGKDLLWEMRSLLIEKTGPNLRNRVCHGLMSSADINNSSSIFLLWLTLHLILGFQPNDKK